MPAAVTAENKTRGKRIVRGDNYLEDLRSVLLYGSREEGHDQAEPLRLLWRALCPRLDVALWRAQRTVVKYAHCT